MSLTFDRATYGKLLVEVQPKVITSEEEYDKTIRELRIVLSSPHEIIQHLMEAQEIKQSDLVKILGSLIVVSEIINGKQEISKAQAKVLGEFFHVSPRLFI